VSLYPEKRGNDEQRERKIWDVVYDADASQHRLLQLRIKAKANLPKSPPQLPMTRTTMMMRMMMIP
jgi:hypothetical protein